MSNQNRPKTSHGRNNRNDAGGSNAAADSKNGTSIRNGKRNRQTSLHRNTFSNSDIPATKSGGKRTATASLRSTSSSSSMISRNETQRRRGRRSNDNPNPLALAKHAQSGNFSPESRQIFLEKGIGARTLTEEATTKTKSWVSVGQNIIKSAIHHFTSPTSKRPSSSGSSSSSNKRRKRRHNHCEDSMVAATSAKSPKKQESAVVNLANSDSDTDDPDTSRVKQQQSSRRKPTQEAQKSNDVYGLIGSYSETYENQKAAPQSTSRPSTNYHALHDSSGSLSEQEDGLQERTRISREKRATITRGLKERLPDFSIHSSPKDMSDDESDLGPSLFPQSKPRSSKPSLPLQAASNAAKTRKNPDLASMKQTKMQAGARIRKSAKRQNEEVINIDDDDHDDPYMGKKTFKKEKQRTPPVSGLPQDLAGTDNNEKLTELMTNFDEKTNKWKQEGASPSATTPSKNDKSKRKKKTGLKEENADDGDGFWGGKGRENGSVVPSGIHDCSSADMRRMAEGAAGENVNWSLGKNTLESADRTSQGSSILISQQLRIRKKLDEKTQRNEFNINLTSLGSSLDSAKSQGSVLAKSLGLGLTKVNGAKRRAHKKIKPGASTLHLEQDTSLSSRKRRTSTGDSNDKPVWRKESDEILDRRERPRTRAAKASSPYFDSDDHLGTALSAEKKYRTKTDDPWHTGQEAEQDQLIARSRINLGGTPRSSLRNKKKKKPRTPETITLSSDSEPETDFENKPLQYQMMRIGIGKRVYSNNCRLYFEPDGPRLRLQFDKTKRNTRKSANAPAIRDEISATLTQDTLATVKFYRLSDDSENDGCSFDFFAFQIKPDDASNNLSKFSNSYRLGDTERQHIVLEFRSLPDFDDFLLKAKSYLAPLIGAPGEIRHEQIHEYAKAMIEDSKKTVKYRQKNNVNSAFIAGRDGEQTLLVYPFDGDCTQMEAAAAGLTEASGKLLTQDDKTDHFDEMATLESCARKLSVQSNNDDGGSEVAELSKSALKAKARKHYVTIRVKDYERLDPEEWLNDSLVDFWMQWIRRHEDIDASDIHFFTSHFYTTLLNEGAEAVMSWTSRKKLDIFQKKFIFIPINKDLHWSLCVVVNPGAAENSFEEDEAKKAKLSLPCLIFFDSLNLHRKKTIRTNLQKWLNAEWKRLRPKSIIPPPFQNKTFGMFTPRVPRQNNTWDCGVFVCRYAYAIYQLRDRSFTYGDVDGDTPFHRLIVSGSEFDFDMNDIIRFRQEFKTLIENLSQVYTRWKRYEQTKPKLATEEEEEAGKSGEIEGDENKAAAVDTSEKENVAGPPNDRTFQTPPLASVVAPENGAAELHKKPAASSPAGGSSDLGLEQIDDGSNDSTSEEDAISASHEFNDEAIVI